MTLTHKITYFDAIGKSGAGATVVLSQKPRIKALWCSLLDFVVGLGRRDHLRSSPPPPIRCLCNPMSLDSHSM
jgi:hypothetical protein